MYSTIMVPVDLDHADTVEKALKVAVDIGRIYDAEIYLLGVTATTPGSVARNPDEYGEKLAQFTAEHSQSTGYTLKPKVVICNDPVAELDVSLEKAGKEIEGIEEVAMEGGGYLLFGGCAAGDTAGAIVLKIR